MAIWDKTAVWVFVFLLPGVVGQSVNYSHPVCAARGSTVTLPCSFTPLDAIQPNNTQVPLRIQRVVWCKNHEICHLTTPTVFDSESPANDPRYQYLGDKTGNCTLRIHDVQKSDDATFRFRMEANHVRGHFTKRSGARVRVEDQIRLRVNSSDDDGMMTRGQKVTLHCTSACTFHQLNVTWFRDGRALSECGPALQLGPLTAGDSGNYSCALNGDPRTRSPAYALCVVAGLQLSNMTTVRLLMAGVITLLVIAVAGAVIRRSGCVRRASAADQGRV